MASVPSRPPTVRQWQARAGLQASERNRFIAQMLSGMSAVEIR